MTIGHSKRCRRPGRNCVDRLARELDSRHLHLQPKDGRGSLDFRVAAEKIRDAIKEWQDKYDAV